ncbi:MAG: site-specific DNA-methyltransferase [Rubrobacter sp.]|jgi:DNA modification methylase|nr:site-specific DNA-methyltransferase [Rubrobacter sp.]
MSQITRHQGNARDLSFLPEGSVDLVVTSPPYWQRRDYGHPDQLGQERTPEAYVKSLVEALNGWARLLRPQASVFLNLGDTYRDTFLAGIPARFEVAAREAGWNVANQIVWAKDNGLPEPLPYRLANRHEALFHLTRAKRATAYFFDLYALSKHLGKPANPGDVWDLRRVRNKSNHLAPFPPELARCAILVACPERVCAKCWKPAKRVLEPTTDLDASRPQAVAAMRRFKERKLTDAHVAAIRAVGISDAGKGKELQNGSGRNSVRVRELAAEAKEALGGYFREFTFAPKRHVGWNGCECDASTAPGVVLDPFMGSGTTLSVAQELGRDAVGVDLVVSGQPDDPEPVG